LLTLLTFLLLTYALWQLFLLFGWMRSGKDTGSDSIAMQGLVSVIVPFRNEEAHLAALLSDLCRQSEAGPYEIILVDDHSSDGGTDLLHTLSGRWGDPTLSIRICRLEDGQAGKKAALKAGVDEARGVILLFTDADVRIPDQWVRHMRASLATDGRARLVCGPVAIEPATGLKGAYQALEYGALMLAGAGSLHFGLPLLCSGANLILRKDALEGLPGDPWKSALASGDDLFLMQHVRQGFGPGAVTFLRSPAALVRTAAAPSFRYLLYQRMRWAGKTLHTRSPWICFSGLMAGGSNLAFVILSVLLLAGAQMPPWGGLLLLLKIIPEGLVLFAWTRFSGQESLRKWIPALMALYPLAFLVTLVATMVARPEWKGRKIVRKRFKGMAA